MTTVENNTPHWSTMTNENTPAEDWFYEYESFQDYIAWLKEKEEMIASGVFCIVS
jgi:hypothetical protein